MESNANDIRNTHVNSADMHAMRERVDELTSSPAIRQAVDRAIKRGKTPGATPFERYASRVLCDAGGIEFTRMDLRRGVQLVPPGEGHLAQIVWSGNAQENEVETIIAVQDTVNRLCGIVDALEDSADLTDPLPGHTITMSPLGGAYKPDRPLYRSAHIHLPTIGKNEHPDFAFLSEVDWRALDHVPVIARVVFQSSMLPNMYQAFMGASAPTGSDWDVRTRLVTTMHKLELPLSCTWSFDCNVAEQLAALRFTVPSEASFPQLASGVETDGVVDVSERLDDAQLVYALRLGSLLAAAAFGAGRHIEHVSLCALTGGRRLFTCRFNRHDFVHRTLTAIQDATLLQPALRFDPLALQQVLGAEGMWIADSTSRTPRTGNAKAHIIGATVTPSATAHDGLSSNMFDVETMEALAAIRTDPHQDKRPLPNDLGRLFHAKRICDVDTRHFHGEGQRAIEDARLDSNESILAAIASLEHTIAEMENVCVPPDDDADALPLFCSNALSRAVVSLLDDELTIGSQAESFLHGICDSGMHRGNQADGFTSGLHDYSAHRGGGNGSLASEPRDSDAHRDSGNGIPLHELHESDAYRLRYFRAPDALFQAHVGLSDLYARLGDYRGAEAEANRCIALAPTTAQSYYLKADALAQQDRYAEAANTLVAGLRFAVSERDCALLYYHLALVLWKLGRKQESASVHVYAMSLAGEYAEKSAAVVRSLRQRKEIPVIVHASPLAATREMARARIPLAPSDEARTLVVQAAVGLCCANAPAAASPYAAALTRYFRNDPVLTDTARSIHTGCAD